MLFDPLGCLEGDAVELEDGLDADVVDSDWEEDDFEEIFSRFSDV